MGCCWVVTLSKSSQGAWTLLCSLFGVPGAQGQSWLFVLTSLSTPASTEKNKTAWSLAGEVENTRLWEILSQNFCSLSKCESIAGRKKPLCDSRMALPSQKSFIDFCKPLTHSFQEFSDGCCCGLALMRAGEGDTRQCLAQGSEQCERALRCEPALSVWIQNSEFRCEPSHCCGLRAVTTPVCLAKLFLILCKATLVLHLTYLYFLKET